MAHVPVATTTFPPRLTKLQVVDKRRKPEAPSAGLVVEIRLTANQEQV